MSNDDDKDNIFSLVKSEELEENKREAFIVYDDYQEYFIEFDHMGIDYEVGILNFYVNGKAKKDGEEVMKLIEMINLSMIRSITVDDSQE